MGEAADDHIDYLIAKDMDDLDDPNFDDPYDELFGMRGRSTWCWRYWPTRGERLRYRDFVRSQNLKRIAELAAKFGLLLKP